MPRARVSELAYYQNYACHETGPHKTAQLTTNGHRRHSQQANGPARVWCFVSSTKSWSSVCNPALSMIDGSQENLFPTSLTRRHQHSIA